MRYTAKAEIGYRKQLMYLNEASDGELYLAPHDAELKVFKNWEEAYAGLVLLVPLGTVVHFDAV